MNISKDTPNTPKRKKQPPQDDMAKDLEATVDKGTFKDFNFGKKKRALVERVASRYLAYGRR